MQSSGPAEVFIARFNEVVEPLNLNDDDKTNAVSLLADYLHGFAFSMQFSDVTVQEQRRIYEGSMSLYLKAVTPVLPQ
jgi:hypothetical protein